MDALKTVGDIGKLLLDSLVVLKGASPEQLVTIYADVQQVISDFSSKSAPADPVVEEPK